jgi:hypothetical protein
MLSIGLAGNAAVGIAFGFMFPRDSVPVVMRVEG